MSKVSKKIKNLRVYKVYDYSLFDDENQIAAESYLSRAASKGEIIKIGKGKFYKRATSLKLLDDANNYKNIKVASIEKIAAGKLYTILKYRIKSRDFYDLKYIIKHYNLSFGDINGKTIFHLACDDNKFFEYLLFHKQEIPENIKTICENMVTKKHLNS